MKYQPVKILHVTVVPGLAQMKPRQWLALAGDVEKMKAYPSYWQARTTTSNCGHKHKTEAAAEPCATKLQSVAQPPLVCIPRRRKAPGIKQACATFQNVMPAITGLVRMAHGL